MTKQKKKRLEKIESTLWKFAKGYYQILKSHQIHFISKLHSEKV
jgi:hypothetical protein